MSLQVKILAATPAPLMLLLTFLGKAVDLHTILARLQEWPSKIPSVQPTFEEDFRA